MISDVLLFTGGFAVSAIAVGGIRRYALDRSILDLPNERSSHHVPTPSGGGLGLIVPFVAVMAGYLVLTGGWSSRQGLLLGGVLTLAWVGWIDDRTGLSIRLRLAIHVAAGCALLPLILSKSETAAGGVVAGIFWVLVVVSAINVVNFMDGIDGLIGSQLFLFGVHLALRGSPQSEPQVWGLVLAATCGGFLVWNWPPARVFMGDAGSGALGLVAVAGGLLLVRTHHISPLLAFLPLYPLFLDAATTLARRIMRRDRIWEAHRSHLYQRLANGGWGHLRVTLLYAAAAAMGIVVAALPTTPMTLLLVAGYLLAGLILGALLDRIALPVDS
jgi:Fuc2NAc and GlcNAc transferase